VKEMVKEFKEFGIEIYGYDPPAKQRGDRRVLSEGFRF